MTSCTLDNLFLGAGGLSRQASICRWYRLSTRLRETGLSRGGGHVFAYLLLGRRIRTCHGVPLQSPLGAIRPSGCHETIPGIIRAPPATTTRSSECIVF
ncbi:hypothetical protein CAAN1_13S03730 [[Candida] anglica]|uniref:Uncharacterized protein n=1 Tax=[Candida] anglica TaxID=148631 RepID=A0ABP0EJW3_9ASCO